MNSRWMPICCAFIALCVVSCTSAFAKDDLYLCGIVKEIDKTNNRVRVDITSQGCKGTKLFQVPQSQQLKRFQVGEETCFMIASNTCPQNQVAVIVAE